MTSIPEPKVTVIQDVGATPSAVVATSLFACVLGPCFQIVSAFSDEGVPQSEALAGIYRDGLGVVAYDFPNLKPQASFVSLENEVRVFLVYGGVNQELNPESEEATITTGTTGALTVSTGIFTDASGLFVQEGVEVEDVLRFTYQGNTVDLKITAVTSDTQLTVTVVSPVSFDLSSLSYSIIRDPAEFVVTTLGAEAVARYQASLTNYLTWTVLSSNETYTGSNGDQLTIKFTDSAHYLDGTDGATGAGVFSSAGATFTTSVGAVGSYPTTKYLIVGTGGDGSFLKTISSVISANVITIEVDGSLTPSMSGQTYRVITSVATGTNGACAAAIFTSAGASFLTTIPNTAGVPDSNTYIEIIGEGIYAVSNVDSNTQLTLGSTPGGAPFTGKTYLVGTQDATNTDGATAALTTFVSAAGGFSALTDVTVKSVNQAESSAAPIGSVTTTRILVLSSGFASSFSSEAFSIVKTTSALEITFSNTTHEILVSLERTAGLSSSTFTEILDAFTVDTDPAYNEVVAAITTLALTGSGATTITGADLPLTLSYDGGVDAYQLLLDKDLLGSTTPTAQVYVSYKALRVDVSDAATTPVLYEITSEDDIVEFFGAVSVDNPLALACFAMLQASPTVSFKALGIKSVTATKPDGTLEAYTSALTFLESKDVYSIAPLTQDPAVHGVCKSHVEAMAAPDEGQERICFISQAMPLFAKATTVASGTDGNTGATFTSSASAQFSASVNFSTAGVQAGDILVVTSLASSDDSPDIVNGAAELYGIDILGVDPGDDFVLLLNGTQTGVSTNWNSLVDVAFTVYRPGAAISQAADQTEAVANIGEGFATRRVIHSWPPLFTADVEGTSHEIKGYYLAAMDAALVGVKPSQQGFTRMTLPFATGLKYSNTYFSRSQLDRIAGGGTFIHVQDSPSAAVRIRHQLTTDVTSLNTQELSLVKNLDWLSKDIRVALSGQTGVFNITDEYLDALAMVIDARITAWKEAKKIISATRLSLEVSESQPDKITTVLGVLQQIPANYIEVTIST